MKIFIFEDDINRKKWFELTLKDNEVVCTDDLDLAVKCLMSTKYDMVFLDHDLEDKDYTGMDVAHVIGCTKNKDSWINIHSMNVVAAERMRQVMNDAGCGNVNKIIYSELLEKLKC